MEGAAKQEYIDKNFANAWQHYDVNEEGDIEVGFAPQFTRMLLDDQFADIYVQKFPKKKKEDKK